VRLSPKALGTRFTNVLEAKSSSAHLAETVVDELFIRHQILADAELAAVRKAGASNQELIVAAVISTKTRQSARRVLLEVKNGSKTWGALLLWANVDTKNMQYEITRILKLKPE